MACYVLFQSFKQTLSCPVCNCLFQDPVTLDCGHSFCQACIKVCDMEREKSKSCPQCGEFSAARKYVPNKTLVQNVDKIKAMEQAICAHNCTTHVFGTCCIPDCNVQSIDIRMQMCFRHWALLISKMDECLYTDKGHRETPAVTRETENNSKDSGHQVQTQEVSVSGTEKHHYNQEPAQERPKGHSKIKNPSLTVEFPSLSSSRESICSIDRPVSFKHGKASSLSGDSAISMYGDESRSSSPSVPSSSTSSVSEYELDDAKTQNAASSMRFRSHSYSVPTRCTGNFKKAELKQLH